MCVPKSEFGSEGKTNWFIVEQGLHIFDILIAGHGGILIGEQIQEIVYINKWGEKSCLG